MISAGQYCLAEIVRPALTERCERADIRQRSAGSLVILMNPYPGPSIDSMGNPFPSVHKTNMMRQKSP